METLVDLIIPRTETPGAVDADVPYRIDRQVATRPELQDIFAKGLATLSPIFQRFRGRNRFPFSRP